MALSAPFFAAQIEVDGADALDYNLAMTRDGQDVGLERRVGLEGGAVDGDMDVGGRAEDPVVAGRTAFMWFDGIDIFGEASIAGAMLTITVVVAVEETGDVGGAGLDRWWW
jgi:hypothetical protein